MEEVLKWILEQEVSVNFYMFHGGTNFGFMNGANEGLGATNESSSDPYGADVTSYGRWHLNKPHSAKRLSVLILYLGNKLGKGLGQNTEPMILAMN